MWYKEGKAVKTAIERPSADKMQEDKLDESEK